MKAKQQAPAPIAIEDQLTCPTCEGLGMLSGLRAKDQTSKGINIADKESARFRAELSTRTLERDGWREIGLALFESAFGQKMGGFGALPPTEVLDAIKGDANVVDSLRDALIGRAWRVRGKQGENTCDYPLCPNRVQFGTPDVPRTMIVEIGAVGTQARLRVCSATHRALVTESECVDWARWVKARARSGRIEVLP